MLARLLHGFGALDRTIAQRCCGRRWRDLSKHRQFSHGEIELRDPTGAGYCPRCGLPIDVHPLDAWGVDVSHCPDQSHGETLAALPPCIFNGCVSRDRHWHGGFPGGYDDPADPEGPPILFTTEPAPGVRDYNGALLSALPCSEPGCANPASGWAYDVMGDGQAIGGRSVCVAHLAGVGE